MKWTIELVEALSPDANNLKRGKGLATTRKWLLLEKNENAIWGECQGSGKKPYYTQIDIHEPAFKCSCPSRVFPCKHALGLFLIFARDKNTLNLQENPPSWVSDWLKKRSENKTKKLEKAQNPKVHSEKQIAQSKKRAEKKIANVLAGLQDLKIFLEDSMRLGLAELFNQPSKYWQEKAARMVDVQAPGMANLINNLSETFGEKNWQEKVLHQFGFIFLIIKGFEHLSQQKEETQEDIKTVLGFTTKKETLLNKNGIQDHWMVMGKIFETQEQLDIQRTWLLGEKTGKWALILDFSFNNKPYENQFFNGQSFEGELVFYPSNYPQRALIKEKKSVEKTFNMNFEKSDFQSFLNDYSTALSQNPFLFNCPALISNVIPVYQNDELKLMDKNKASIPVHSKFNDIWELMAMSLGKPITIFGEWNGYFFKPLI